MLSQHKKDKFARNHGCRRRRLWFGTKINESRYQSNWNLKNATFKHTRTHWDASSYKHSYQYWSTFTQYIYSINDTPSHAPREHTRANTNGRIRRVPACTHKHTKTYEETRLTSSDLAVNIQCPHYKPPWFPSNHRRKWCGATMNCCAHAVSLKMAAGSR